MEEKRNNSFCDYGLCIKGRRKIIRNSEEEPAEEEISESKGANKTSYGYYLHKEGVMRF